MLVVGHRFPLQPLLDRLDLGATEATTWPGRPNDHLTGVQLAAAALGVTPRTIQRLQHSGLSDRQADHYANRIGAHPSWIWQSEWWWNAPGEYDLPAERRVS